jgi:soluble lytic murein transglycosylase
MRRVVCAVAALAAWGATARARAWSEEPLCALRTPVGVEAPVCADSGAPDPVQAWPSVIEPAWVEPVSMVQARFALDEAERLVDAGRPADAVLHLRVVEHAAPAIADRLALRRAEALARVGMQKDACLAYELAAQSDNRDVAVRGRVGAVRCLLDAGDKSAEERLTALFRRYPQVSERRTLRLKLGQAKERWGQHGGAVAIYKSIDLHDPGSPEAVEARGGLERLRASGVRVGSYTPKERVERAERMFRNVPTEMLEEELASLARDERVTGEWKGRVHLLGARLAREQGAWDAVRDEVEAARRAGANTKELVKVLPPAAPESASDADARAEREVDRRIEAIVRKRPLGRLSNAQIHNLLSVAVAHGRRELVGKVLDVMRDRDSFLPSSRFEAAVRATGIAPDEALAGVFGSIVEARGFQVSARYHQGRALERVGRLGEAEALYLQVVSADRSATRYYAMWAEQRLWALRGSRVATSCTPAEVDATPVSVDSVDVLFKRDAPVPFDEAFGVGTEALESELGVEAEAPATLAETLAADAALAELEGEDAGDQTRPDRDRLLLELDPVVIAHGAAFPWLARARDLVALGLFDDAADEVHEAYLAWRDAKGSPRLRSGLEAVFTGNAPPKHPMDYALRRARIALDSESRAHLSNVARMLGDTGTALGLVRWRQEERPRAYAAAVEGAAKKYGLDPNLLFAVMRVESIFNRRIVSYAGAVGLMQIMPRTGYRIAQKLGRPTFEVTDLLDPELNLEFSAWYLASLLERFDGNLPLAIASYNGGPHNVRLWMRASNPEMPLDAFLERIPFSQTHRYVRRVLTHYAAYRAQKDLPMTRLDESLPRQRPDRMAF